MGQLTVLPYPWAESEFYLIDAVERGYKKGSPMAEGVLRHADVSLALAELNDL